MKFSLMTPKGADLSYQTLTDEAVDDLSIDFILDALTENHLERPHLRSMLTKVPMDPGAISYRHDIFEDFLRFPELREAMSELVLKLSDLRDLERFQMDKDASALWSLINRLREIDDYMSCINMIRDILTRLDVTSSGMKELREIVTNIALESGFDALKADIDETMKKAQRVKSVTIGVNLDKLLRPEYAGIVSLNDTKFGDPGLMSRFKGFTDSKDDLRHGANLGAGQRFHSSTPYNARNSGGTGVMMQAAAAQNHIETSNVTGKDPLSDAMRKQVTEIMKKTVNDIKSTIKKYVNINGYSLISLMPEILFYNRWAELTEKLKATGMPLCKPEIIDPEERRCTFKDVYNLKLAINKANGEEINIIANDFEFSNERRIYILTGPNRGGKTIFTQAIGLAMLMAQWGIYIPAASAQISPCDNIYTHFPADENDTVDLGRLGEESQRLSGIFEVATRYSLLLLNESLATTSVAEGVFIAKDVVKAMRYLGTRAIFNTHMHELAGSVGEINASVEGDSRAESLITVVHDGERSFKVSIAPPQGVSYAADIAKKYGVTFAQIKQDIDSKHPNA
ncbi:MAG: hypothetical protein IJH07_08640 [Ruminococcus sp.]|nr:hypothetical protein [Ruminococcus sp.]